MADLTCGEGGSTGAEIIADINANTVASANNAALIQTNVTAIDVLEVQALDFETRIAILENSKEVNFVSVSNILAVPETFVNLATLSVIGMQTGVYYVGFSTTHTFDTTTKSVFHRMTINGGAAEIFAKENKDVTDRDIRNYTFMYSH